MLSAAQGKLEFKRHDLHTTVSSNRGCLLVYPPSGSSKKSGRQRVAVGDSSGVVTVFQVGKHHDLQTQFETGPLGKPISRLALYQDQLFAAAGSKISAFSRKGKLFFFFDNNMTEAVKSFHVDTPLIFAGGDYTLTYFQESTEKGFYMSPDRINDLVALPARSQLDASSGGDASEPTLAAYHSYLACQDRALRVVRQTELVGEVNCEASLSSLTHMRDGEHAKRKFLVYGTSAGSIGVFALNKRDELVRRHSVIPETRLGVISALASFDVTEDGVSDIIVGREDGSIEVHACGTSAHSEAPQLVWSGNVGEYINTVAGGNITQTEREELLLHSFSGKVVSFALSAEDEEVRRIVPNVMSSQAPALPTAQEKINTTAAAVSKVKKSSRDADDDAAAAAASALEITHAKVVEASKEIEKLRSLLDTKRHEYATVTKQQTAASAPVATPAGATAPPASHVKLRAVTSEFKVRDSLSVDGAAALLLSIESDVALEVVTVQSEVAFEVLDSESTALMSNHTLPDGQQVPPGGRPTAMLCVLRPAEDRPKRVHVTLRAHEGEYGSIQAFVIPKTVPRTAQLRTFKLLPLALHVRISESDAEWSSLPLSSVTLTGPFTIRDAHSWMLSCIPDVPEVVQVNSETASLYYRNQFEGTVLSVRYEKGQIVVLSDNFNALAIMKTHLTKEATNRKMSLKMESQPLESSLRRHLFSLTPLIAYQCGLSAKLQLVDALKELEGQEDTAALLDDEYKEVLASASTLQEESRLQPRRLEYLRHIVLNLAKQKCVFLGQSFTPHLQRELLMSLGDVTGGASLSSPPSAAASLSTAPSATGGVPQSSQMNADRGSSTGVASGGGDSNGAMNGSRGDHTTAKHIVFDAPRMFKLFGVSMEDPEENGSSVRGGAGEGMPPPPPSSSVPMFSAEEVVMPTAPPQEALIL